MLAPAAAVVCAATVLIIAIKTLASACTELRDSLRKSSSAAVAGDELSRGATQLGDHAESTRAATVAATARLRHRRRPHKPVQRLDA